MNVKQVVAKQVELEESALLSPERVIARATTKTDRGATILLSQYLDELLGRKIRTKCSYSKSSAQLLQSRGSAGTFRLKIELCEAFDLIRLEEAIALFALNRLRNESPRFVNGHGFGVLFDQDLMVDEVEKLTNSQRIYFCSREYETVRSCFFAATHCLALGLYSFNKLTCQILV